jgi:hypothetical protein
VSAESFSSGEIERDADRVSSRRRSSDESKGLTWSSSVLVAMNPSFAVTDACNVRDSHEVSLALLVFGRSQYSRQGAASKENNLIPMLKIEP